MKKRFVYLYILLIIPVFSACGIISAPSAGAPSPSLNPPPTFEATGHTPEAGLIIPAPSPVITDESPPPEIPLYNDYNVSLDITPETRTISGIERAQYTNRTAVTLDKIVMRVYLNAFNDTEREQPYFSNFNEKIYALGSDSGYMDILHVSSDNLELSYETDNSVLTIYLDEPLLPEQTVSLKIQFDAYVPKLAHRIGGNEKALWCALFLPTFAVYGINGWNTDPYYPAGDPFYTETANYIVDITTQTGYTVAGAGIKPEEEFEDKKTTLFNARLSRGFTFAVSSEYQVLEAVTASGVTAQFYYYSAELPLDNIMDTVVQALEYYEGAVGVYPYRNLSVIETDMFVNDQDFTQVAFIDSAYLHRTQDFSALVQEIGNQWFGHAVGNNQMTEAWLDEGITMYLRAGYFHRPEESQDAYMKTEYAALNDYLTSTEPSVKKRIAAHPTAFANWNEYYQMNYTKAMLMLYALRLKIGGEAFLQLIPEYYKAYSFRVATAPDFITKAEEIYGESLAGFFQEWLYGVTLPEIWVPADAITE
jgi:hypothetical protein